jgi:hypothetical protein
MKTTPKLMIAACLLILSGCASSSSRLTLSKPDAKLDRAEFESYTFKTVYSNASRMVCDYGKERLANFGAKAPPNNEVWGGNGTHTTWAIYPELKCSWLAADGSQQQEVVKTGSGLFAKYVEWEHFEGETLVEDEPLQLGIVTFTIRVDDKKFYILRDFTVQLHGERLSEHEYRVKTVDVEQVIYRRP